MMNRKARRILIILLSAFALTAGGAAFSCADTPAAGEAVFDFTLEKHSLDHQSGFFWGVADDTDDSTYSSLMAECSWQDGGKACWYHYAPTVYVYVGDAEYDGNRHGGTLKWRWDNQAAPDQDFHTINGNSDYPDPDRLPGVRVWNTGHDGETLAGERYIKKEAPTLPGKYAAEALVSFESLGDQDAYQLVSPHYEIKPKELTLNWSGDTEFAYDGKAHAPTVELPANQIIGNDVVSVTRTTETKAGAHTAKATLTGKDSWKYTIAGASQTRDYVITSPYNVQFDSNVPANASTTCTGSMASQHFEYDEAKALSANGYSLPGYDFDGWNTKADGTGTKYANKEKVKSLSKDGGTVTLYAQWSGLSYTIEFNPGELGGNAYRQKARFDQPGKLETYSDAAFGWGSGGRTLHGWSGAGFGSFYEDGASFLNLCGAPDADGNLANVILTADWVNKGQIIVTVTKDDAPQPGLVDDLNLVDGSGTEFTVYTKYENGKYTFDPSQASAPGTGAGQLPEGEYDLSFEASGYPKATAHIMYGEAYAASVVFDYCTVSLMKDPAYADFNKVEIGGAGTVEAGSGTVVVQRGGFVNIKTTVDEGYQFDGYTVAGVAPVWEDGDPSKAEQTVKVQGRTDILAHIKAAPATEPTISDITSLTGDDSLTYGYAADAGRISVTASAATDTEYKDLTYQWYSYSSSDSGGSRPIDTTEEPSAATKDYVIPVGKTAGNYHYYCKVTATRQDNDQTASAYSSMTTVTVEKHKLTITANDQTYVYNGQIQGEGDTVYEDPAQIAEKVTVEGLQGDDALTSIIIDGQGQDVGEYDLVPSNATIGEATGNYKISYVNGTLTITSIPLNVTVKGSGVNKVFSGKQQTCKGTVTAKSSDPAFDVSKFSYTGSTVVKGTDAGSYTKALSKKSCSYKDKNYAVNWTVGDPIRLTIKPAKMNVTVSGSAAKKVFNGKKQSYKGTVTAKSSDKAFKASKFSYTGSVTVTGTAAGSYTKAVSKKSCSYKDKNYKVSWTIGSPVRLTIKAAKKPNPKPRKTTTGPILAKMTAKGKRTLRITWTRAANADGYDVFLTRCNHGGKTIRLKKAKTVKGNRTLTWTKKGLKKNTAYKVAVKAWIMKNGKKKYIRTSPMIHAYTAGGSKKKYTNPKSVMVKKTKISLRAGKKYRIKAKVTKLKKGRKLITSGHAPRLRYLSSNKKIATVSTGGRITAKRKGRCKIFVYAANGVSKAVAVTVR